MPAEPATTVIYFNIRTAPRPLELKNNAHNTSGLSLDLLSISLAQRAASLVITRTVPELWAAIQTKQMWVFLLRSIY